MNESTRDLHSMNHRRLTFAEVEQLLAWAREEGWNPGPYDAEVFWKTDPEAFIGFFEDQQMIAGGAIVSYGGDFGFMGLFIVDPQHRGKGIGRKLWYLRRDKLLERLKPGAAIGMDGVVAMQDFYHKGGFTMAYRENRYLKQGEIMKVAKEVGMIAPREWPEVLIYDQQAFGFNRAAFLEHWLQIAGDHKFRYRSDGKIHGFAVVRKAHQGFKIGPLFADSPEVAEELYRACLNSAPGESISIDVPVINQAAMAMTEKYGAEYVFECGRMYYGDPPGFDVQKVFGVTSFELG